MACITSKYVQCYLQYKRSLDFCTLSNHLVEVSVLLWNYPQHDDLSTVYFFPTSAITGVQWEHRHAFFPGGEFSIHILASLQGIRIYIKAQRVTTVNVHLITCELIILSIDWDWREDQGPYAYLLSTDTVLYYTSLSIYDHRNVTKFNNRTEIFCKKCAKNINRRIWYV